MAIADEESRAALYRAQQASRAKAERERARQLTGSPQAAKALRRRVEPLIAHLQEGSHLMADEKKQAKQDQDAGQAEVQERVNEVNEQGFLGVEVDVTPNQNYTLQGVTSDAPTPETDEAQAEKVRQAARERQG